MDTIEDVVRSHVSFFNNPSAKGWHPVFCEVCGDGTHSKGPRGGWLFQGEMCFYNCFNCGVDGNFDPNRETPHSKEMWDIFRSFGIPKEEINKLLMAKIKNDKKRVAKAKKVHLPKLEIPEFFTSLSAYPLGEERGDTIAEAAHEFLWDKYKIKSIDYPFYLATIKPESSHPDTIKLYNSLQGRVIIPAYKDDKMMFWQARLLWDDDDNASKYISATVDDSNAVVYGLNNMFTEGMLDKPLYITEGFFDAWHVNGIAVITNTMKPAKVTLLERTRRPKVVIPDMNKDGMNLAQQAIDLGWGVSLPRINPCVDICQAINKFGKLYVIKTIVQHTYHGYEAKLRLKEFRLKTRI